MRELERHTAYERAEQDLTRTILQSKSMNIEADLQSLLERYGRPPKVEDMAVDAEGQDDAKEVKP